MDTFVILFRGINVGGNNLVPMKELVSSLEEQGYQDVRTYIQSGNVVLKAKKVNPGDITRLIQENFGFSPEVLVLKKSEFLDVVKKNPFHPSEGKLAHFYFCSNKPKPNQEKLDKYLDPTEAFKLVNNVFYLQAPKGIGRSKLVANIDDCLGVAATGRNLNTINKLADMLTGK